MKLKWLGHAAFLITASNGATVLTDPYTPGGPLTYSPVNESADVVTQSHGHGDHNNVAAVKGSPKVLSAPGEANVKGIYIKGIPTFHDTSKGSQRGQNVIFVIEVDGIRVVHLGDLGHSLDERQRQELGRVDVLLAPVGGYYTIDGPTASQMADTLGAKVAIPMHFKTEGCAYPISDAQPFLSKRRNVRRVDGSEVELTKDKLPATSETVVLKPAH